MRLTIDQAYLHFGLGYPLELVMSGGPSIPNEPPPGTPAPNPPSPGECE